MHMQNLTMLGEMLVVLLDVALLMLPFGAAVPLSAFYSYGSAAGDSVLPPNDDGSSPAITLPAPFRFFTTYYTTIYVSYAVVFTPAIHDRWHLAFFVPLRSYEIYTPQVNNNGDLSFGAPWSRSSPTAFPIPNIPLVAPYQADVDTRGTGRVWYRSTQNTTLLAKAANAIRLLNGTIISPQWLFIATWDHVGYYPMRIDKVHHT